MILQWFGGHFFDVLNMAPIENISKTNLNQIMPKILWVAILQVSDEVKLIFARRLVNISIVNLLFDGWTDKYHNHIY